MKKEGSRKKKTEEMLASFCTISILRTCLPFGACLGIGIPFSRFSGLLFRPEWGGYLSTHPDDTDKTPTT